MSYSSKLITSVQEDNVDNVEGIENQTCCNVVDMDVSDLVQNYIQRNIDVEEIRVERCLPKQLLLPTGYHEQLFDDIDIEGHLDVSNYKRLLV